MNGKSHVAAANVSSLAVATFLLKDYNVTLETLPTLLAFSSIGGLLADIDHAGSKLSNDIKVTKILAYILKHRGFTHTILFILIACFLLSRFVSVYPLIFFGIGMLSHLVCDILTPAGLRPFKIGFEMLDYKIVIPIVKNEKIEKIFYYSFMGLFALILYKF